MDEDNYSEWINDIGIWQLYTDLDKAKQGPAVYLSLSGKARDSIRDLKVEEIGHVNGVKTIIEKLNKVFLKEEHTRAYLVFKEFYDYHRPSGVSMSDF